jgi:hypothetical protein
VLADGDGDQAVAHVVHEPDLSQADGRPAVESACGSCAWPHRSR